VKDALLGRWEPVYRSRLQYLITWSTRGRKSVLRERHSSTLTQLIASICEERGVQLLDLAVGVDHVHALIALRPTQSVASVVRELKGRAGLELMLRHPELRVWLGGNLVWDERYAVETSAPAAPVTCNRDCARSIRPGAPSRAVSTTSRRRADEDGPTPPGLGDSPVPPSARRPWSRRTRMPGRSVQPFAISAAGSSSVGANSGCGASPTFSQWPARCFLVLR